ncbi:MAG: DNA polymerase I [Francisellaceae bacterium]|nr:DNA polymerase I [Francisellaceae bacterium]
MSKIPSNPFVLVDGSAYLFRAFHALPPLINGEGMPTGAIYGVVSMMRNLMDSYKTDCFVVVFDAPGGNFRHKMFPEYKANRSTMPEELAVQIPHVIEIIKKMGIPVIIVPGVEADDVIATLSRQANEKGLFTLISSGDKDLAQLVNENIVLVNTMTNLIMDRAGVFEKFKVYPEQMVDYLALVGDSVDNIPGVSKVGPKTAVKWLDEYKTLDNIIANSENIKGKVGENLRAAIVDIPLYVKLVTVVQDLDLEQDISTAILGEPDNEGLYKMFKKLEFKKWTVELKNQGAGQKQPNNKYETVLDDAQLAEMIGLLNTNELVAIDIETTSTNSMVAQLMGVAITVAERYFYVPVGHAYEGVPTQLPVDAIIELLEDIVSDTSKIIIVHDIKYNAGVLKNLNIDVKTKVFDTMLASYVYDSVAGRHDVPSCALRFLEHEASTYEEVAGKGAKQVPFSKVSVEDATQYSCENSDIVYQLYNVLKPKIDNIKGLHSVFYEIEMPLVRVLLAMERCGVLIDSQELARQSQEIAIKLDACKESAFALAGEEFNFNSPKQLQEILFEKLGLPVISKTPKGAPSTAEQVLVELAKGYELPNIILSYRGLHKLKSTYTDSLPQRVSEITGRIHTSYHQAITSTGRLSSTEPNLQNIPIKTADGRRVREAFIASPGYMIISADYSQIELRIMAHFSKDEQLLQAFKDNQDVHKITAAEVFDVSLDAVTDIQRRHAKAVNFGLMYGMSAFGLSQQLSIERGIAQEYIDSYFAKFPSVKKFMERTRDFAHMHGFVETLFGRRLYLPDITSSNAIRRKAAERAAINAPMQGGQADIIKRAMIGIHDELQDRSDDDIRLIMQVHDELVFEVTEDSVKTAAQMIKEKMTTAASLDVELLVEIGAGSNWGAAH